MTFGCRARLLSWLLILALTQRVTSIDDKCGACRAVQDGLFRRVDAEVPKNHLDMRHRLAADGTRYGKVIAYKMSELRMDALLSTLCDDELKDYQWVEPSEDGKGQWMNGLPAAQGMEDSVKQKEWKKQLVIYCHSLMETHEDVFIAAIRDDEGPGATARTELCIKLGVCAVKRDEL